METDFGGLRWKWAVRFTETAREAEKACDDGWEPFAIAPNQYGDVKAVYFRKKVQV